MATILSYLEIKMMTKTTERNKTMTLSKSYIEEVEAIFETVNVQTQMAHYEKKLFFWLSWLGYNLSVLCYLGDSWYSEVNVLYWKV